MAKKEETISLIDTFSEFKELKNIDRTTMVSVLEESLRSVIAKMFGTDENYDVIVNPDKGDFEIWRNREVVADEDLENPNLQITLSEARKIDASYEVGEEVTDEVIFANFGRRAILNLRQTLASKILELEKDSIYNKYIDKVGNLLDGDQSVIDFGHFHLEQALQEYRRCTGKDNLRIVVLVVHTGHHGTRRFSFAIEITRNLFRLG